MPIQPPLDPFYSLDPLLGHSAMLSVRDKHGDTALHKVCKFPQPLAACAVYRLLRYGADPWARNSHGQTPLHCACALLTSETPHVVKELVTFIAERQGRKAAAKVRDNG